MGTEAAGKKAGERKVHADAPSRRAAPPGRPLLELADIVRVHGEAYLRHHAVSAAELRVLRDVASCRTAALGGHIDVCDACGHREVSYNSCRNRHCPKCQSLSQAKWIEARMARVLPTHHFHVVFTLPAELRPLALANREKVFDLLFASAAQTLLELGHDAKRLGALLGVTAVLHTWSRDLSFHPHVHCIVTGGGLSPDGTRWVACRRDYFMPVLVLGALFRGKMLAGLRRAYDRGELVLSGRAAPLADPSTFAALLDVLYQKRWVVYAKPPFGGAEEVFRYLGRYTHRVGLSNHRLLGMDARGVRLRTRGDKAVTLAPEELLRRFLMHVLPPGYVKIRHYRLLSSSHATSTLEIARAPRRGVDERGGGASKAGSARLACAARGADRARRHALPALRARADDAMPVVDGRPRVALRDAGHVMSEGRPRDRWLLGRRSCRREGPAHLVRQRRPFPHLIRGTDGLILGVVVGLGRVRRAPMTLEAGTRPSSEAPPPHDGRPTSP